MKIRQPSSKFSKCAMWSTNLSRTVMRSDRKFLHLAVSEFSSIEERKDALVDVATLEDCDVLLDGVDQ